MRYLPVVLVLLLTTACATRPVASAAGGPAPSATASSWQGRYEWGSTVEGISVELVPTADPTAWTLSYVAGYQEETASGSFIVAATADGGLSGVAQVDGDPYRFTGRLSDGALCGTFARREFDEWLDEGRLDCTPKTP